MQGGWAELKPARPPACSPLQPPMHRAMDLASGDPYWNTPVSAGNAQRKKAFSSIKVMFEGGGQKDLGAWIDQECRQALRAGESDTLFLRWSGEVCAYRNCGRLDRPGVQARQRFICFGLCCSLGLLQHVHACDAMHAYDWAAG